MKYFESTLDNCDKEPIHIIGSIQSYGYLLVLNPADLQIVQLSENVSDLLHCEAEEALGAYLDDFFPFSFLEYFSTELNQIKENHSKSLLFTHERQPYILSYHFSDGFLVLEIEKDHQSHRKNSYQEYANLVDQFALQLEHSTVVAEICQRAIDELRPMLGFDRMMVYRFDNAGHGEVISESKEEELETFLGLRYPSSDIPAQARELYRKSYLRGIYDVEDIGVRVIPEFRPQDKRPLDLSHTFIRSVSPIHIQYLRNMGVRASFSISILVRDQLWGMILCHHSQSPVRLNTHQRRACRFMGKLLGNKIDQLQESEHFQLFRERQTITKNLSSSYSRNGDLHKSVARHKPELLSTLSASHYLLQFGYERSGTLHDREHGWVEDLQKFLEKQDQAIFYSKKLSEQLPGYANDDTLPAGVLAIRISKELHEYLYFFRPALVKEVEWAGKPTKEVAEGLARLGPRNSFDKWVETIHGESAEWETTALEFASELRTSIIEQTINMNVRRANVKSDELNKRLLERSEELIRMNRQLEDELQQFRRTDGANRLARELAEEKSQMEKAQNLDKVD